VLQSSLAGAINGKIYVAGGCSSAFTMEDGLWEYDPATDRWTAKALAPMSLPSPAGSVVDGKLYLFDECSFDACFWDFDATGKEQYTFFGFYDPATNRWTRLPLPPVGVWPTAAATFKGKLYFLGTSGQVNIYNPTTGAWTTGARNQRDILWKTTAVVASKWYVVGQLRTSTGGAGASFLSVYDPATNTWVNRAAPPAEYLSANPNGLTAGRVFAGGVARLELVGGPRPNNNWQYTP
jgi:N-acetylneuraminic acid mutarotase